jgi:F-type H+-transporting ATPase subunit epsilon
MSLSVSIVTPNKVIYETDRASLVVMPGEMGEFGVLKRHIPLLSGLKKGKILIWENGASKNFEITGGFAEVLPDKVTILAQL